MASIKSVFSAGAGKVKEIAGLQYNDAAGGSLDVTLPISSNASIAGSSLSAGVGLIDGGSLNIGSAAVAVDGFSTGAADNDKLTTKGYVDDAVADISAGVSLQNFTVAANTGLAVGQIVCLGTGTNAPLVIADKDADLTTNAIGVIKTIVGTLVTVQLDAEIVVGSLSGFTLGEAVFVGDSGAPAQYSALATGDFATQVGYVSDVASDKIVIQIKSFGELA
jgi:hypothetical protein